MNHEGTKARRSISGRLRFTVILCAFVSSWLTLAGADNGYDKVDALFQKHCLDCHNAKDAEGQLILESYDLLMKGGESGDAIIPGKSAESILVRSAEGTFEKDGKRRIMPPGSKRKKLDSDEIALIKSWIDAGAKGPTGPTRPVELVTPKIPVKGEPRRAINGLGFLPATRTVAMTRYGSVELWPQSRLDQSLRLPADKGMAVSGRGFPRSANAAAVSFDSQLFVVGGEPGMSGEVQRMKPGGQLDHLFSTAGDALYSAALAPNGRTLAVGSYDAKIFLADVEQTKPTLRTLTGHNGAVFGLAFRPDGKILASASADRTIKLWNVEKGRRTDTLPQPLKEQYAVVFSADGKQLYAGGADSRIRIFQISDNAAETTNPMIEARYAHEGTILRLALSPNGQRLLSCSEDRSVKIWDAAGLKQLRVFEKQPDWISAAIFLSDEKIAVGRMDGSLDIYNVNTGEALTAPMLKAELK